MLERDDDGDLVPGGRGASRPPTRTSTSPAVSNERELHVEPAHAVQGLPERERLVVALYYVEKLTMKDIAVVLNVSETRVSQLHAQGEASSPLAPARSA